MKCANCGKRLLDGVVCNLTCKRALQTKVRGIIVSKKEEYEMREGLKAAFVVAQVERFLTQLEEARLRVARSKMSTERIEYW